MVFVPPSGKVRDRVISTLVSIAIDLLIACVAAGASASRPVVILPQQGSQEKTPSLLQLQIHSLQVEIDALQAQVTTARLVVEKAFADEQYRKKSPFMWWQVVPWGIAVIATLIAFTNFRRSRYPHISIKKIVHFRIYFDARKSAENRLSLRLFCYGSDLYDLRLRLEIETDAGMRFMEFKPMSKVQEPIKNGQYVQYQLTDADRESLYRNACPKLSSISTRKISIVAYASGDVEIKRIAGRTFVKSLRQFDSAPNVKFIDHPNGSTEVLDRDTGVSFTVGIHPLITDENGSPSVERSG